MDHWREKHIPELIRKVNWEGREEDKGQRRLLMTTGTNRGGRKRAYNGERQPDWRPETDWSAREWELGSEMK